MRVLSLNSGSSSLKFAIYDVDESDESLRLTGQVAPIGAGARLVVTGSDSGRLVEAAARATDASTAAAVVFDALDRLGQGQLEAIGHRIVHGGADHLAHAVVDDQLLESLRALVPFAPLHLPSEISVVEEVMRRRAETPQVACFDTVFHRRLPEAAQRYPLPADLWRAGVRRYGFHGLSYEYVIETLGPDADGRVVVAHLGSGASVAAVSDSVPVDTTMGFTPTGGIPMGTRSGDLDPGLLIHLLRHDALSADDLERLVNQDAGLLGLSGTTSDMKALLRARASDPEAALAVEVFCRGVRATVGAYAALLGGLDTLVFTGGIGENAEAVRTQVCDGLGHLGVSLDEERNAAGGPEIGAPASGVATLVLRTREEQMIARHTRRLVT